MSYDISQVAFVDTETTGLDPDFHLIWEIAVIVDGNEHQWTQFIAPSQMLAADQWVIDNTRLADYDPDTSLDAIDSIRRFAHLTEGRHLIGACPWFDSERLHRVHRDSVDTYTWDIYSPGVPRLNPARALPWHYHLIDIENMAIGYLKAAALARGELTDFELPWKSTDVSRQLGVDPESPDFQPKHSALADARWAKAVFEAMWGQPR